MSLMGAEAIADAAVAYFNAYAAAKVAAVAARSWAVTLTMEAPKAIRVDDPFRAKEYDYPVWYVMPEDTGLPTAKGGDAVLGNHRFVFAALVHHPGAVAARHSGGDTSTPSELAGRLAMRHALTIYELLMDMSDIAVSSTYYANGQRVKWGTGGQPIRARYLRFDPSDKGEGLALCGLEASAELSETR
jgi:hypothetical protein